MKASGDVPEWRLTVCCAGGLANRLKVLTSGLALAEATGRAFRMLWPLSANCAAPFGTLFTGEWSVVDIGQRELDALPGKSTGGPARCPTSSRRGRLTSSRGTTPG